MGTNGIVVSSPRIPFHNETYESIRTVTDVSKIYIDSKKATDEWKLCKNVQMQIPDITLDNFLFPLRFDKINKINVQENQESVYNLEWLNNNRDAYTFFTNALVAEEVYQITYNKGEQLHMLSPDQVNNPNIENGAKFFRLMKNPIISIKNAIKRKIYFMDIKFDNMIYIDDKIKIIDFSDVYNFREKDYEYIKVKIIEKIPQLHAIFYMSNNLISSTLIFLSITQNTTSNYFVFLEEQKSAEHNIQNRVLVLENLNYLNEDFNERIIEDIIIDIEVLGGGIVPIRFSSVIATLLMIYNITDDKKNIIDNIFTTYKSILESTNSEDINSGAKIIHNLLETNNMFAIGFIFIHYIVNCYATYTSSTNIDIDTYTKIIKIIIMCCGKVVYQDDTVYVSNYKLDDVIRFYESVSV